MTDKETRAVITPFAFKIDERLLGRPLARPGRRAGAIGIDLIVVAILSVLPAELLALLLAAVSFSQIRRRQPDTEATRVSIVALLAMVFCVLVAALIFAGRDGLEGAWSDDGFRFAIETDDTDARESFDPPPAEPDRSERRPPASDEPPSLIDWTRGLVQDLGLGFGWAALYFTVTVARFHGRTLGKRLLGTRVLRLDGRPISLWNSFERYGGYGAGMATGLLGFLQIYWDPNRQAIHDKIVGTVVVRE